MTKLDCLILSFDKTSGLFSSEKILNQKQNEQLRLKVIKYQTFFPDIIT